MSTSPNLQLTYVDAAQSQKHVPVNTDLKLLDAIVQMAVINSTTNAPPGSPADGDRYIVGPSPTGAWAGKTLNVTAWQDGVWVFYPPKVGWSAYDIAAAATYRWTGSAWISTVSMITSLDNLAHVGINTTADATNKLAVKSSAILFDNIGNGAQVKVNKNAVGDTASIMFQDAFSGRAEIGLTGDDNFHFKVSPDGTTFRESIIIDKSTGNIGVRVAPTALAALQVSGSASVSPLFALGIAANLYVDFSGGGATYLDGSYAIFRTLAGTEVARLDTATGRLGIGTNIPLVPLSVIGSSGAVVGSGIEGIFQIGVGTGAATDEKLQFGVVSGVYSWIQAVKPGTSARILALNPLGGGVGINTTNPLGPLHVVGSIVSSSGAATGPALSIIPNAAGLQDITFDASFLTAGYGPFIFKTTATERMRIDASGNVGITVTSPRATLDVGNGNNAAAAYFAHPVGSNGEISLIGGGVTQTGYIQWLLPATALNTGTRLGYMGFDTSNVTLTLQNSANFIVSGGRVGIGTTGPGYALQIKYNDGVTGWAVLIESSFTNNGALVLGSRAVGKGSIQAITNVGALSDLTLNADGGNVGIRTTNPGFPLEVNAQVRVSGSFPRFSWRDTAGATDAKAWQAYANSNTLTFSALNDAESAESVYLLVARTGATVNTVTIFPTLALGNGNLFFPATQNPSANANTLDDYEEGSWAPVLSFGGASVGIAYTTREGRYQKVGNAVHWWCHIVLSSKGSSTGNALIGGLPFTSSNTVTYYAGAVGYHSLSTPNVGLIVFANGDSFAIYNTAAGIILTDSSYPGTVQLIASGSYEAA